MRTRLSPEEALSTPLYVVAAVLVAFPFLDLLTTLPAADYASVHWRFAAIGQFSSHTLQPILGVALAFVVSAVTKNHALQRVLVLGCLTSAMAILAASFVLLVDSREVRTSVPFDGLPAFSSALKRALAKLLLTSAVLGYLGWRARLLLPVPSKQKTPRTVHVVSK